jgi:hypothetical protein
MKVVNIKSGKSYQLKPGTVIEIERPNPFFNDYGEQSMPLTLPASEYNRALLSYQEDIATKIKQQADIEAAIIDKDFYMTCRQAVLSSQKKGDISTSFYLNEGAFYTKLSDINLKDIFGTESIPNVTTVDEGIAFCRTLITGTNENYVIFPVLIDYNEPESDSASYTDNNFERRGYKFLNRWGNEDGVSFVDAYSSTADFYNAKARTEITDGYTVHLSPGYYITPFFRANYLLKRIFSYLGYTVNDNFFTTTVPFKDMAVINNTMDSLVNGDIRLADLVPNCTISSFLEAFRKKFCCEFIPNEIRKTIDIVLFKDVISTDSGIDLTKYMTSHPIVSFPNKYQQLRIGSEDKSTDDMSVSDQSTLEILISKYPHSYMNKNDGNWYREGSSLFSHAQEITMNGNNDYCQDAQLKEYEIMVPDKSPITRLFIDTGYHTRSTFQNTSCLYIGESQALNSALSNATDTTSTSKVSSSDQKPMFGFYKLVDNFPMGFCTNYYQDKKLYDYTLYYNGPDGIFEKFYREYDTWIRNSKHTIKVNLLLSDELKMNIPAHQAVILQGQKVFVNSLKFNIGGENSPEESEFYTIKNHTPVTIARTYDDIIVVDEPGYSWSSFHSRETVTKTEYDANASDTTKYKTIYPPAATSKYVIGQHYFDQVLYGKGYSTGSTEYYFKDTMWWQVIKS